MPHPFFQADRIFAKDAVMVVTQSLMELKRRHGAHLFANVHGWQGTYQGNDALCEPPPSFTWKYGKDLASVLTEVRRLAMLSVLRPY